MLLQSESWHWVQNADLTHDGHNPNGDKTPDVVWDFSTAPSLVNLTSGTPYSADWLQYVTGAPPGTVFTVATVSGDNATTEGWSISGSNLANTGAAGTGAGAFTIHGNYNSGSLIFDSPVINWSYVSAIVGKRWTPGHYFSQQGINTFTVSHLNEADAAGMVGAWLRVTWSSMEPTKNNYDWTDVDLARDQCLSRGMKLIVILMTKFNSGALTDTLPAYLSSEPNSLGGYYAYDISPTTHGWTARMDASGVIDRLLLLAQAFCTRYNNDTTIEGLCVAFDSVMPNPRPADFFPANHAAQRLRIIQNLPGYATKFNVFTGLDFLSASPGSDLVNLKEALYQYKCGIAGIDGVTDVPSDNSSDGLRAFRGLLPSGANWVAGGIDRRLTVPCMQHISTQAHCAGKTAQQVRDIAFTQHGGTHFGWIRKSSDSGGFAGTELYWRNSLPGVGAHFTPDVETYITTGGAGTGTNTGCPTQYGGSCNL